MSVAYRPDIDGLRAIAVAVVILYHAHVPGFSGGFIGVDVFFVVSGYLITSLLMSDAARGGISIKDFYDRRIRRIFPALFVVMAVTVAGAWFIYAPHDFEQLGRSVVAASLFYSNVWFWFDSGYFEAAESQKPLLHTWSLAVEEQFYLIFPLLLMFTLRFFRHRLMPIFATAAVVSLLLAAVMVERAPSATFYLLPTRAWELLIGSLLAWRPVPVVLGRGLSELLVTGGVAVIVVCSVLYSDRTVFPGLAAVPPTFATAMIIVGGTAVASRGRQLLASGPFVLTGKISYSLYLWHFPLFAFAGYLSIDPLTAVERTGLIIACVLLSLASWRYVEVPARQRSAGRSTARVFAFAGIAMAAMVSSGLVLQVSRGFPARLLPEEQRVLAAARDFNEDRGDCSTRNATRLDEEALCVLGTTDAPVSFVLWGDSHGEVLRPAVGAAALAVGRRGVYVGSSGCLPLATDVTSDSSPCLRMAQAITRWIAARPTVDTVIIASRWALWSSGLGFGEERGLRSTVLSDAAASDKAIPSEALERAISATVGLLSERRERRIWLVGPVPEVGVDVPRSLYVQLRGWDSDVDLNPSREAFDVRQGPVIAALSRAANLFANVGVVWPHETLCDEQECHIERDGRVLYIDDDHLSRSGVRQLDPVFARIFSTTPDAGDPPEAPGPSLVTLPRMRVHDNEQTDRPSQGHGSGRAEQPRIRDPADRPL